MRRLIVLVTVSGMTLLGLVGMGVPAPAADGVADAVPNGMIAFHRYVSRTGHVQIFTMNPDGTHVRELTFSRVADSFHPIWSPDGSKLVFERDFAAKAEVFGINADGTGIHAITHGGFSGVPAYSPNGKLIAFEWGRSVTDDGIWVMSPDGTHRRRVTRNPRRSSDTACECDTKPHWSPDGNQIVFARVRTQRRSAVFTVNVDGTDLRRLTEWAMNAENPAWSPDGTRIAFNIQCCGFPGFRSHIFTIRPDGGGLDRLTRDRRGESFDATWSPDGKMIAFAHYPGAPHGHGFGDIYEMKADGSGRVNITHSRSRNGLNNSEEGPWWGTRQPRA